jgi:hypothetical protein
LSIGPWLKLTISRCISRGYFSFDFPIDRAQVYLRDGSTELRFSTNFF